MSLKSTTPQCQFSLGRLQWLRWNGTYCVQLARWFISGDDISVCQKQDEVLLWGTGRRSNGLWMWIYCRWHVWAVRVRSSCPRAITAMHPRTRSDDTSPWILSICPSLRAAPRTLQRVRTILSALASERKALESRMDFLSPEKHTHTHSIQYRWHWIKTPPGGPSLKTLMLLSSPCCWGFKLFFATSAIAPRPRPTARPAETDEYKHDS